MAIVTIPHFEIGFPFTNNPFLTNMTNNAVGETAGVVGFIELEGGSGSKTLSAAGGGKILIATAAVTWATASSEYRIGIEDITALTGIPDGIQDVYGAKIAGTHSIAANSFVEFAMTSGTKTITHGDFLGIIGRMPVRAGTDSIVVASMTISPAGTIKNRPYGYANSAKIAEIMWAFIIFDDGTAGWVRGTIPYAFLVTITPWNPASIPDEYAATFEVSAPIRVDSIGWLVSSNDTAGDDYDMRIFSDPYGTPVQIAGGNVDSSATQEEDSARLMQWTDVTPVTLMPGTVYAVAMRMTSGQVATYYYTFTGATSSGPLIKKMIPLIKNVKLASRSDNTGVFTEVLVGHVPAFALGINGLDDGTGSGTSAEISAAYVG